MVIYIYINYVPSAEVRLLRRDFLGNEYASYSDENLCRSGEMGDIAIVAASKWGQGRVVCKRDKG